MNKPECAYKSRPEIKSNLLPFGTDLSPEKSTYMQNLPQAYQRELLESAYQRSSDLPAITSLQNKQSRNKTLKSSFEKLAAQWKKETRGMSSINKIILNPNYLKIIALGKEVLPLILESLSDDPDHWFVALAALSDDKPTSPGDSFQVAVDKWIAWGIERGYISA